MRKSFPKYLQLAQWIKEKIQQQGLVGGDRFYTEHELAAMFSVSRQTVRQALNTLINEGILESRQGSGTYIALDTYSKRTPTKTIGLIVTYFDEYIFPSIINGIESVLTENGYTIHLACTRNDTENEARALKNMLEKNVDGLIVEPTKSALPNSNMDIYREIEKYELPLIFLNSYYNNLTFPYVALDDVKAGYMAAKCLIDKGHKKICMALKSDDLQGHLRYQGACAAAAENNIQISKENIFWFTTEDIKYFEDDKSRFLRYIRGCTAVLCYNDQTAAAVINILKNSGYSLPQDFSVMGIDDAKQATVCSPQLTTIAHPKKLVGQTIASNLLRIINKDNFDPTCKFEPQLIVRDSVADINI